MKYVNDKSFPTMLQKYTKLLALVICTAYFLNSCSRVGASKPYLAGTIVVGDDSLIVESDDQQIPRRPMQMGIERLYLVVDSLKGKRVAVVGNQTSVVKKTHLVDTLLSLKVNVTKVFSPEHGFRGEADAGEKVNSSIDKKT